MAPRGVLVGSGGANAPRARHEHVRGPYWSITSNVALGEALLTAELVQNVLPGRLGQYFLPHDAVFCADGVTATTKAMFTTACNEEEDALSIPSDFVRVNHMTVDAHATEDEGEFEGDEAEDEEDDVEDGDGDEGEEDLGDDDDEDDKEWSKEVESISMCPDSGL